MRIESDKVSPRKLVILEIVGEALSKYGFALYFDIVPVRQNDRIEIPL